MKVCHDDATQDKELWLISEVMLSSSYSKKFVEKAISHQLKRDLLSRTERNNGGEEQQNKLTARIPFVNSLSQEVCQMTRLAQVDLPGECPSPARVYYARRVLSKMQNLQHEVCR